MKKFLMIAVMAMSALTMSAQGKMAVGANINLGIFSNSHTCMGFGAKFQYEFIQNLRGEAGFEYYTNCDGWGTWDINVNAAYLFPVAEKFKLGPMAGLTVVGTHGWPDTIGKENVTTVGLNIGAAGEYQISDSFKLGLDVYYKHARKDIDLSCGLVISATAAYCF